MRAGRPEGLGVPIPLWPLHLEEGRPLSWVWGHLSCEGPVTCFKGGEGGESPFRPPLRCLQPKMLTMLSTTFGAVGPELCHPHGSCTL